MTPFYLCLPTESPIEDITEKTETRQISFTDPYPVHFGRANKENRKKSKAIFIKSQPYGYINV